MQYHHHICHMRAKRNRFIYWWKSSVKNMENCCQEKWETAYNEYMCHAAIKWVFNNENDFNKNVR